MLTCGSSEIDVMMRYDCQMRMEYEFSEYIWRRAGQPLADMSRVCDGEL